MTDPAMPALVEDVERDLLNEIIDSLQKNRLTEDQAKQYASEFLALLPIEDKHELLDKLKNFSSTHVLAKGIFLKYAKPVEEEERQRKLTLMSQHIKNGQIEHALQVAKGGS